MARTHINSIKFCFCATFNVCLVSSTACFLFPFTFPDWLALLICVHSASLGWPWNLAGRKPKKLQWGFSTLMPLACHCRWPAFPYTSPFSSEVYHFSWRPQTFGFLIRYCSCGININLIRRWKQMFYPPLGWASRGTSWSALAGPQTFLLTPLWQTLTGCGQEA